MPPRKSNVSIASANDEDGVLVKPSKSEFTIPGSASTAKEKEKEKEKDKDKDKDELAIEDLTMPRTMVQRLAKGVLPSNTQIQKDAITALSKSATVFINHLSNAAQAHTYASNRKTIMPQDVFSGLRDTEYTHMIPRLEAELAKYNEIHTAKRNEYRKKVRDISSGTKSDGGDDAEARKSREEVEKSEELGQKTNMVIGRERPAKRAKGEDGESFEGGRDEGDVEMNEVEEEDEDEDEDDDDDEENEEAENEGSDDNEEGEETQDGENDEEEDVIEEDDDDEEEEDERGGHSGEAADDGTDEESD